MSWPSVELASESHVITKGTTPTSVGFDFAESGIPFVRVQNLAHGTISMKNDTLFVDKATHDALKRSKIFPGDLLISIAGTIGRTAIVPDDAQEMNCNQAVAIIRPKPRIDKKYLRYWLESDEAVRQISKGKVTATISNLSLGQIGALRIPLPPLEEQKRIAAILDQADSLRRLRQRAIDRLNTLGQAIFHEMCGDPKTNPKALPKDALGNLIKVSSGDGLTSENMRNGPYPVYGGNGINGWHDESRVAANTIIIGRVGVYCGAVHITDSDAWVTDNALIVYKKREINTTYLASALKYSDLNQYAGRSAQPLVSGSRIYPVEIPVPPPEEQESFERKVKTIQSELEKHLQAMSRTAGLFSSLQHRAFRGEL
jgi:type I restriction enzyme S subunit